MYYESNNYLQHFGVKGMKWGVRRYQNEDRTLTPRGKKKISKQYKKYNRKVLRDYNREKSNLNAKAKIDVANYYDVHGGIQKFDKKYGKLKDTDPLRYDAVLSRQLNKDVNQRFMEKSYDFMVNNKYAKKGEELEKKYSMLEWDEFAKQNKKDRLEIEKMYNIGKTSKFDKKIGKDKWKLG